MNINIGVSETKSECKNIVIFGIYNENSSGIEAVNLLRMKYCFAPLIFWIIKPSYLVPGVVPIVLYCNTIAKYCNTLALQHHKIIQ